MKTIKAIMAFALCLIQATACLADDIVKVVIDKNEGGELGYNILAQASSLNEVNYVTVKSGILNNDDWNTLKDMQSLTGFNISGTSTLNVPDYAFNDKNNLTEAVLPSKLESIGECAFTSTNLTTVVLPETLKTIGRSAFANCSQLLSVNIPGSLKEVSNSCFSRCNQLEKVTIGNGVEVFSDWAFNETAITSIHIPSSARTINYSCFDNCRQLESLTIDEGLETIGYNAFQFAAFKSLKLPNSLRKVDEYAFAYNVNLTDLDLGEGVQTIGRYAFGCCQALKKVVIPSTVLKFIDCPFGECSALEEIEIRAIMPPFTNNSCPVWDEIKNKVRLVVPSWSREAYMLAAGWKDISTVSTHNLLPQNITIDQDYHFIVNENLASDYHPDIHLEWNDITVQDPNGNNMRAVGSITVSNKSFLNANKVSLKLSPRAYQNSDTRFQSTSIVVNGQMRAEQMEIKMVVSNGEWMFCSFPFDVRVRDIVPDSINTDIAICRHDPVAQANLDAANTWVMLGPDDIMEAGKGYIINAYNKQAWWGEPEVYFTVKPLATSANRQAIFSSEDRELKVGHYQTDFEYSSNWNYLANPWAAYYDTRFIGQQVNVTVWDIKNKVYKAYSTLDDSYILYPCQAFFVQAPVGTDVITLRANGRQTTYAPRTIYEGEIKAKAGAMKAQRSLFNIALTDGTCTDQTRVVLNNEALQTFEYDKDAMKMMSNETQVPQIYTLQGTTRYAINERPDDQHGITLEAVCPKAEQYTISLNTLSDANVTLIDLTTGQRHSFNADGDYTFSNATSNAEVRRFTLLFNQTDAISNTISESADGKNYDLEGRRSNGDKPNQVVISKGKKVISRR